mgnify:FL=1
MKKLLVLLLLSFGFIGSSNANVLTDLFFPKLEKYDNCIEDLKKQKINNRNQLCADKYAKIIDKSFIKIETNTMNTSGLIKIKLKNISDKYSIKKIEIRGYVDCDDSAKCKYQNFSAKRYFTISPGEERYYEIQTSISLTGVTKDGWSWGTSLQEFSGFKVDY